MDLLITPLHMGNLHPFEQALTLLLAFGPFAVLAVVVVVRRRADAADTGDETGAGTDTVVDAAGGRGVDGERDQPAR